MGAQWNLKFRSYPDVNAQRFTVPHLHSSCRLPVKHGKDAREDSSKNFYYGGTVLTAKSKAARSPLQGS
jgi:hypothetical protein